MFFFLNAVAQKRSRTILSNNNLKRSISLQIGIELGSRQVSLEKATVGLIHLCCWANEYLLHVYQA